MAIFLALGIERKGQVRVIDGLAGLRARRIDDLVGDLRAAKGGGYQWVSMPFFLDLVLRKPVPANK
jgi:hypothetical protein